MDIWNYAQPYYGKKLAFAFGTHFFDLRWSVLFKCHKEQAWINVSSTKISGWTMHKVVDPNHFRKGEMGRFRDAQNYSVKIAGVMWMAESKVCQFDWFVCCPERNNWQSFCRWRRIRNEEIHKFGFHRQKHFQESRLVLKNCRTEKQCMINDWI